MLVHGCTCTHVCVWSSRAGKRAEDSRKGWGIKCVHGETNILYGIGPRTRIPCVYMSEGWGRGGGGRERERELERERSKRETETKSERESQSERERGLE